MKNYKFLPYNENLVSRARELRKESTGAEKIFWNEILKNKKLLGLKFTRQKPIAKFIIDFYCASLKLGIEIDGEMHTFQKTRDRERDNILWEKFGVRILRYRNQQVLEDLGKIIRDLEDKIPLTRGTQGVVLK